MSQDSNQQDQSPDLTPAENSPTPLAELFLKDPLKITKDEFVRIVAFYREERKRLLISDAEGKPAKSRTVKKPSKGLSLADLGLTGTGGIKL